MKSLNDHDYKALLAASRDPGPRSSLVIELCLLTGARQSEVLALVRSDFDRDRCIAKIATLKRGLPRTVQLPRETVDKVWLALKDDNGTIGEYAYPQTSRDSQSRMLRAAWAELQLLTLGECKVPLHGTRHTFGMRVMGHLKKAGDVEALRKLQRAMGHKNINNTIVYLDAISDAEIAPLILGVMAG